MTSLVLRPIPAIAACGTPARHALLALAAVSLLWMLWSTGATAGPTSWCTDGNSELARAARSATPYSLTKLPNHNSLVEMEIHYSLPYYSDGGVYNPVTKTIDWVTGPGTCCRNPATYEHFSYDIQSNRWTRRRTEFAGKGHAYDATAANPETGEIYFGFLDARRFISWDGERWSKLPQFPINPATPSLTWFPELDGGNGGLLLAGPRGTAAWFDGEHWELVPKPTDGGWKTYNQFSQHNPVSGTVWIGQGKVHYTLSSNLEYSRLKDAPLSLTRNSTVDPATGRGILMARTGWYDFDFEQNVWRSLKDKVTAQPKHGVAFHAPVPPCGGVFLFSLYYKQREVYFYKHGLED